MGHPDLVQTWLKRVTYTAAGAERYEIYPHSAYVLSARLIPKVNHQEFSVVLYTSEAPDFPGDDVALIPLYVNTEGSADVVDYAPEGVLFMRGIYALTEATTDADDAWLQVRFIDRRHHCEAFPRVEKGLTKCWDEARNTGLKSGENGYAPYLENFTYFVADNPDQPVETSGGGSADANEGEPINP